MTTTTTSIVNQKQVWETQFATDFLRQSGFLQFMGMGNDKIVRVNNKLTNEKGQLIHLPMIPKLVSAGISGSTLLRGNEESQRNWSYAIKTAYAGNAVTLHEADQFPTEIDLLNAAKPGLRDWSARRTRDLTVAQLQSVIVRGTYADAAGNGQSVEDTNVLYASATEANKDLSLDNNADRTVFFDTTNGKSRALLQTAPAGGAVNDNSATLATVTTSDKLTVNMIGVMKRKAQLTEGSATKPSITPVSLGEGFEENYVLFCDLPAFRDLQADMRTINLDGRPRDVSKNPVFTGDYEHVNGVLVVPIPTMGNLGGVGASSAVIGTCFLAGASALGVVYSMKPTARVDSYSYDQQKGVGIVMADGYGKIAYNGAQAGIVTGYCASVAD